MNKELRPRDIKYGLIAIDPMQEGDMKDIVHFCGYWTKPSKQNADQLRQELLEDESFGLTEIANRLDILPAPDYIVQEYVKIIIENE